jgi:hypothetical protein
MRRIPAKSGWPMRRALTRPFPTPATPGPAPGRSDSLYWSLQKRAHRSAAAALAASVRNRAIWEPGWFRAQLAGAAAMACAVPRLERADDALGVRE